MKKKSRRILSLILMLAMMLASGIGSGGVAYAKTTGTSKTATLEKTSVTLAIGGTSTIKVKNAGKAKITHTSLKPAIAKVTNKGKVTAVQPGNTKIKVVVNNSGKKKTLYYSVKVSKPTLQKTAKVYIGSSTALKLKYLPKKATVKWTSDKKKIATVSKKGLVTGKAAGKATITAKVTYNKKTYKASTTVTIKKNPDDSEEKSIDINNAVVGSIVKFGRYEQDNDLSNGKEPIEWQVLAKENSRILVVSKYALDCQLYNTEKTDVTWDICTLRTWLNKDFLNSAFNQTERAFIPRVTVTADKNPNWPNTPAGKNTSDKVFLLSADEVKKYFPSENDCIASRCAPTAYAKVHGVLAWDDYKSAGGKGTCWWWLRTPGDENRYAAIVHSDGNIYYYGSSVDCNANGVRPALWIGQ